MKSIALFISLSFFFRISAQTKLYGEKIVFNYKSVSLTAENLKQIRNVWEHLPPDATVELFLVSDKEIKKLKPLALVTLSKARADAVNLFLTTQKIVSPHDIELNMHSFTEDEAIYGTSASFKRIVKNPYKVYSLVLSKEVPLCYDYTAAERKALSSKEPATFQINANQDAMIKGPDGVIIQIPANSFILPIEKISSEVTIKLWEFLSTDDIILAGLSTKSSGRLLETGGMIYFSAEHEGTCIKLLRSSKIIVKFPTWQRLDSMRLFKGVPLAGIIDWQKTNNKDKAAPVTDAEGVSESEGDSASLSYYVLESGGLGWINCDRFSDVQEKIDVAFTSPQIINGEVGLIFTEINSIMPGYFVPGKKDNVVFNNVPKGMEAVLLIYALSADKKKMYYATKKVVLGNAGIEEMKVNETTLAEFKQVLKGIKY